MDFMSLFAGSGVFEHAGVDAMTAMAIVKAEKAEWRELLRLFCCDIVYSPEESH